MPGLFGIYNLAAQSLLSYQAAINTVGHNVANASTEGFHRQRVELMSNLPNRTAYGALGTGVGIDSVTRIQDRFIENAIQREIPILSRYSARADALYQGQLAFGEPSEAGLTSILDGFFDGWSDLASSPEDLGARESVVRLGVSLADAVRDARNRLVDQQSMITAEIAASVDDVNRLTSELESLNRSIVVSSASGIIPADLEDRRDVIAERLADLVGATVQIEDNGTATVRVGGRVILQNESADRMEFDLARSDLPRLHGQDLSFDQIDGRIGGLLQVRDDDLAQSIRRLDEFAARLVQDVNGLHAQGSDLDGEATGDFFTLTVQTADGIDQAAGAIEVRRDLVEDSRGVAAGASGKPADNAVALDLAALRSGFDGPGAMLQAVVVDLGSRARESEDLAIGQSVVVDSFRAQRESVSGVSLDEEASNLMRFQRSYEAAARILTMVDEMAQTLLSI